MVEVVEGRRYRVVSERLGVNETGVATRMSTRPGFFIAGWGVTPDGFVGGGREQNPYRVEAVDEPEAPKVVAGRSYRVVAGDGGIMGAGPARVVNGKWLTVGSWYVELDGTVSGHHDWRVEVFDEPEAPASHPPETTAERHAADLNDLGGNRPRLDERRLELRRLHALERIADALEAMGGWGHYDEDGEQA